MMNIGRKITGFCNSYFGRDDYQDKMIIHEGRKWIVCKYIDEDKVTCLNFNSEEEKNRMLDKWEEEEKENEIERESGYEYKYKRHDNR